MLVNGRAHIEREYDDHQRVIYEAYFGTDMEPIMIEEGYAALRQEYDARTGLVSRTEYLDADGKPVLCTDGYASFEQEYDLNGNLLRKAYFDEKGKPVTPGLVGYAWFERKCDSYGNVLEEAFYDADGNLCLMIDGGTHGVPNRDYDNAKGVHAHDAYDGIRVERYPDGKHGRDMTEREKEENRDIL